MINRNLILVASLLLALVGSIHAQDKTEGQHISVAMRLIGHEFLLSVGDSSSRVLPIEKDGHRYRIRFESEFAFSPDSLMSTVSRVIAETKVAERYIVEVESCTTNEVVHSYEIGNATNSDLLACKARDQPSGCYMLLLTLLDSSPMNQDDLVNDTTESSAQLNGTSPWLIRLLLLVLLLGALVYVWKRRSASQVNPNLVNIGEFRFDRRNMKLSLGKETIELTGKECELLQLLYDSANSTVERDTILKMVWDDEGDYVGRTLDVFISKLRKKLEADSSVKIVNIRGIGYKLTFSGK